MHPSIYNSIIFRFGKNVVLFFALISINCSLMEEKYIITYNYLYSKFAILIMMDSLYGYIGFVIPVIKCSPLLIRILLSMYLECSLDDYKVGHF